MGWPQEASDNTIGRTLEKRSQTSSQWANPPDAHAGSSGFQHVFHRGATAMGASINTIGARRWLVEDGLEDRRRGRGEIDRFHLPHF